jgi:iron complex transport system substrate-binding protein
VRIVSLLPSATEIVCALGLADALVGVSGDCDFPSDVVGRLPVVSGSALADEGALDPRAIDAAVSERVGRGESLYTLDGERIRRLRPDLVLAQDLCRVCAVPSGDVNDALEVLGCQADVLSLDPSTLDDVFAGIVAVGERTGTAPQARALAAELRARGDAVRRAVAGRRPPRVLALEWLDPPFVGGHWVPDMVAVAGGVDVLGTPGAPSRRVGWDEITRTRPEVVVVMPCGYDLAGAAAQAGELSGLAAVAGARIVAVDATSYFSRPGPRLATGVEILAAALHPDAPVPVPPAGTVAFL